MLARPARCEATVEARSPGAARLPFAAARGEKKRAPSERDREPRGGAAPYARGRACPVAATEREPRGCSASSARGRAAGGTAGRDLAVDSAAPGADAPRGRRWGELRGGGADGERRRQPRARAGGERWGADGGAAVGLPASPSREPRGTRRISNAD
ncbi:hypothetical protein BDA96_01G391300 [Sorghum bicolor]|uniref:Uncharacterized protein n=1 Tax=Sorghum bicolor TaxID=4558 RepID=A0A921S2U0_SORBI|nr:hypothetical protein BDA96_01G391300 [Sorghum bicolor]